MSDYYFITSKLNGYVLDITGANTAPVTPIISYPRKTSGTDNQLWERVPTGPKDSSGGQSLYFIKSKLNGFVLDIKGASTAASTPIISYPQKTSGTDNQVWELVFGAEPGYFFITSQLNGNVLDIKGASTAPKAAIISYPRKSSGTDNQLWSFVSADNNAKKKTAFASS
jgi:hypothetical protein